MINKKKNTAKEINSDSADLNVTNLGERGMEGSKALLVTVIISVMLMIGITVISFIAFRRTTQSVNDAGVNSRVYDEYYALICDESDFFSQVYKFAKSEGEANNICVDMYSERYRKYTTPDLLRIAIESGVDGIIVQADTSNEITSLINEATNRGINVVTLLDDSTDSMRRSSVQVSGYNLGRQYGSQVASEELFDGEKILVITDSTSTNSGDLLIFTGIQDYIAEVGGDKLISISAYAVDGTDTFIMEENIREIFKDDANIPDVIICSNDQSTTTVYQALVDYNRVGDVRLLGYYDSDTTLKGIREGVIEASITVDVSQLGEYAVSALHEYNSYGYVSDYYSVDTTLINKKNIGNFAGNDDEKTD